MGLEAAVPIIYNLFTVLAVSYLVDLVQVDLSVLLYSSPFLLSDIRKDCWDADSLHTLCFLFFRFVSPLLWNNEYQKLSDASLASKNTAAKKSSVLAINDWGRNSSDGNNRAQLICFTQEPGTAPHYSQLTPCQLQDQSTWKCRQPLLQVRATKSLEPALLSSEQNLPCEAFTVHFHGNRHMPFLLPRRQGLLFETGEYCAQSISASLRS